MNLEENINKIRHIADRGKLVLFIGAGVSNNFGYPTWSNLIRQFDKAIHYSKGFENKQYTSDEMLKIPQYVYLKDKDLYTDILKKNFPLSSETDNSILCPLLLLKPDHIITTNYDNLIEQALNETIGEDDMDNGIIGRYQIIRHDKDWINADKQHYLIKMHGDILDPDHLVLKENDYLTYSSNYILTETYIKSLLINHSFLFVGYQLGDNNLKLIMSWVDNIVRNSGEEIKKNNTHYFINVKERLNTYESEYYRDKNIEVLEYEDLPKDFNVDSNRYPQQLGKNLSAICNYIGTFNPFIHTEEEYIQRLEQTKYMTAIDCKSLMQILDIPDLCYDIIDGIYIINEGYVDDFANPVVVQAYKQESNFYTLLNDALSKTNIVEINTKSLQWTNKSHQRTIAEKFLNFEFCKLTSYQSALNQNIPVQKLQYLFLNRFLNYDYREREKILDEYNNLVYLFKQSKDVFHQIICDHNRFLTCYTNRLQCYAINEILNSDQKQCYALLEDYINDRFNKLYYDVMTLKSKEIDQFNAYTQSTTYELSGEKNIGYKRFRFKLFDIITYFMNNSIYFSSLNGGDGYISNLCEIIDEFNKLSLLYLSPNSKMDKDEEHYERTRLNKFNIYLLIYFADNLKHLLDQLRIVDLMIEDDIIDYLIMALDNTINYINHSTMSNQLGQIVLNGFMILNVTSIPAEYCNETIRIYTKILSVISRFTEQDLSINYSFINNIMKEMDIFLNQYINNIDHRILYEWLQQFLLSKNTPYKMYIIYRFNIIEIIYDKSIKFLDNEYFDDEIIQKMLDYCRNNCADYYNSLIIQVYNVSSEDIKEQIYKEILYKKDIIGSTNLYMAIVNKIISYDETIDIWVRLCKGYCDGLGGDKFMLDNPYICLVLLYRGDFVKNKSPYVNITGRNKWFDFVYFPKQFDFNKFDTGWSSWLAVEPYIKYALDNKEILKEKYEKAMNNGPTELEKKIYYKYFSE